MSHCRQCDRDTQYLLPPSLDDWLPKDHLARFVVDTVEPLDRSALTHQYRGAGAAAYHPAVLLYGYATGAFGSRRIEHATYDSLAFRFIAAITHPDRGTLCALRQRFLPEVERLFVAVLSIAKQMKRLKIEPQTGSRAPDQGTGPECSARQPKHGHRPDGDSALADAI